MIVAQAAGRSARGYARNAACAVLLLFGLSGCPGTLDPALAGGTGGSGGSGGGGTGGTAPTCDAMAIFTAKGCAQSGCHDAAGTSAGFRMAPAGWEQALVGGNPTSAGSCMGYGSPYLKPGVQPATGLFLDKLKGVAGLCGNRMPLVGTPLVQTEIDCVQQFANGLVTAAGGGATDAGGGQ
jgi:hypothetical protein